MKLCAYIIKNDTGFAPNPFWGYCTLALCTPNHIGVKLKEGDVIAGFSPKSRGNKLVYCMRISEVLGLDEYYHDRRFLKKRPSQIGAPKKRVGDNMYYLDKRGQWQRDGNAVIHLNAVVKQQDTKYARVFVSQEYYYFGQDAVEIPMRYLPLVWNRQGVKCCDDAARVGEFMLWLAEQFQPGVLGMPMHFDRIRESNSELHHRGKKPSPC